MHFPQIYNTYFIAFIATVGGMLFGFDISSMSAIIGTDQYLIYFGYPAGLQQGAIGSALAAGSVVGSIIAGPISNWIGRKRSLAFACLWWLAGTAVQTACNGVGMLIAGRLLNGVCVGITSSQVPVYLAEIAKKEKRGSLIIIQQLAIGTLHAPTASLLSSTNFYLRMGHLNYVLHWLWVQLHFWSCLFPYCMGHPIRTLHTSLGWSTLYTRVTTMAG